MIPSKRYKPCSEGWAVAYCLIVSNAQCCGGAAGVLTMQLWTLFDVVLLSDCKWSIVVLEKGHT